MGGIAHSRRLQQQKAPLYYRRVKELCDQYHATGKRITCSALERDLGFRKNALSCYWARPLRKLIHAEREHQKLLGRPGVLLRWQSAQGTNLVVRLSPLQLSQVPITARCLLTGERSPAYRWVRRSRHGTLLMHWAYLSDAGVAQIRGHLERELSTCELIEECP